MHGWRFVLPQLSKKLNDASEARVDEAITDLTFIHESCNVDLREHQITKFIEKWEKRDEATLVDYLKNELLYRHFSRCDGKPGEPTDTCTLEGLNKHLKGDNYYNSVEGLGVVMERSRVVGFRLSRDDPVRSRPSLPPSIPHTHTPRPAGCVACTSN